jgi:hypothetical protein
LVVVAAAAAVAVVAAEAEAEEEAVAAAAEGVEECPPVEAPGVGRWRCSEPAAP